MNREQLEQHQAKIKAVREKVQRETFDTTETLRDIIGDLAATIEALLDEKLEQGQYAAEVAKEIKPNGQD